MKSTIRLLVLLLFGALVISGCSALRSMFAADGRSAEPASPEATAVPSAPRFTFFDSWASW